MRVRIDTALRKCRHGTQRPTDAWTREVMRCLVESRDDVAVAFDVEPRSMWACHQVVGVTSDWPAERLVDFAWSGSPTFAFDSIASADTHPGFGLLLAAESEWGRYDSSTKCFRMVMDDFMKLVDVRAPVKVMVYGYQARPRAGGRSRDDFAAAFSAVLRQRERFGDHRGDERWLFYGLPWKVTDWDPFVHVAAPDDVGVLRRIPTS